MQYIAYHSISKNTYSSLPDDIKLKANEPTIKGSIKTVGISLYAGIFKSKEESEKYSSKTQYGQYLNLRKSQAHSKK